MSHLKLYGNVFVILLLFIKLAYFYFLKDLHVQAHFALNIIVMAYCSNDKHFARCDCNRSHRHHNLFDLSIMATKL